MKTPSSQIGIILAAVNIAKAHLDATALSAFQEAIAKGYRPEPTEK